MDNPDTRRGQRRVQAVQQWPASNGRRQGSPAPYGNPAVEPRKSRLGARIPLVIHMNRMRARSKPARKYLVEPLGHSLAGQRAERPAPIPARP